MMMVCVKMKSRGLLPKVFTVDNVEKFEVNWITLCLIGSFNFDDILHLYFRRYHAVSYLCVAQYHNKQWCTVQYRTVQYHTG